MSRLLPYFALLLLSMLLTGCAGSLFLGDDGPSADDDDGGDDVQPPDIDLSIFSGVEYLNIRWDPEMADDGRVDCQEAFVVDGAITDEEVACDDCDTVWRLELEIVNEEQPCLSGGTTIDVEPEFVRYLGMDFRAGDEADVYRSMAGDPTTLDMVGRAAFDGFDFSWSGVAIREIYDADIGYTLFFSGEGTF